MMLAELAIRLLLFF